MNFLILYKELLRTRHVENSRITDSKFLVPPRTFRAMMWFLSLSTRSWRTSASAAMRKQNKISTLQYTGSLFRSPSLSLRSWIVSSNLFICKGEGKVLKQYYLAQIFQKNQSAYPSKQLFLHPFILACHVLGYLKRLFLFFLKVFRYLFDSAFVFTLCSERFTSFLWSLGCTRKKYKLLGWKKVSAQRTYPVGPAMIDMLA